MPIYEYQCVDCSSQDQRVAGLDDFLGRQDGLNRDGQIGSIGGGNHFLLRIHRRAADAAVRGLDLVGAHGREAKGARGRGRREQRVDKSRRVGCKARGPH